ncbi:hypothetical protein NPIL_24341, partial [Nephila pilipes]
MAGTEVIVIIMDNWLSHILEIPNHKAVFYPLSQNRIALRHCTQTLLGAQDLSWFLNFMTKYS